MQWEIPRSPFEIRSFLGLAGGLDSLWEAAMCQHTASDSSVMLLAVAAATQTILGCSGHHQSPPSPPITSGCGFPLRAKDEVCVCVCFSLLCTPCMCLMPDNRKGQPWHCLADIFVATSHHGKWLCACFTNGLGV
uniref:Uncharacterized protein n=1 Tax=Lactuca sativa TaxID=4236 RepID=A0A9R1VQI5_LACSA|nr:hypothetical protein LSAT_V11C400195880 [Lactuca sativa]